MMSNLLGSMFSDEVKAKFQREVALKPRDVPSQKSSTRSRLTICKPLETINKSVTKKRKLQDVNGRPIKRLSIQSETGFALRDSGNPNHSLPESSVNESTIMNEKVDDQDREKNDRTIFLGNIPTTETQKSIRKFCEEFGEVESIRIRSVPISGTAVDDAGNQNLVKKVCFNASNLGTQKGSFNAYVVFKNVESINNALLANNRVIGGRHIRVDKSNPSIFDPKRSVFLGGLPHYADEEEIRNHFASVFPNGQDDIEGIRIVRDPSTLIGKGIGYLLLKDRDVVSLALTLHEVLFKKRFKLRVTTCGKRTKRSIGNVAISKPKRPLNNAERRLLKRKSEK